MPDGEAAILAAIGELNTQIRTNHEEFVRALAAAYVHLARSDEVQDVKSAVAALTARLSSMPTRADCDKCRENFVDKRTFLGVVAGLGFTGALAAFYDKIRGWF